ncbi:class I SAM-dependent methyltransferase [Prauserella flavalba]|uniref:Methyltransferase domain-containing protein n=1 Tax=Prauserella flavalba TaxID=1477506 RepID=A0A318LJA3_9PSEU|nr:class I SAM-dependent methyltransferase [Prauserella flavalba]PXY30763.1 hypothetical protein BA062_19695 [Prauserella flavalba]
MNEDRDRWNDRYASSTPDFTPNPLLAGALDAGIPEGPVLELACGRSGNALALAAAGRTVTAVDISDVALAQLRDEAVDRRLQDSIRTVEADVPAYLAADPARYALVMATRYWDAAAFEAACHAVADGGLLAWEALVLEPGEPDRPFRVPHGELGRRLPPGFEVVTETPGEHTTRLLARRARVRT